MRWMGLMKESVRMVWKGRKDMFTSTNIQEGTSVFLGLASFIAYHFTLQTEVVLLAIDRTVFFSSMLGDT